MSKPDSWISNRYRTAAERQLGAEISQRATALVDRDTSRWLKRIGCDPIYKNARSFQISVGERKAMAYFGKSPQVRYYDGETVRFRWNNELADYLDHEAKSSKQ